MTEDTTPQIFVDLNDPGLVEQTEEECKKGCPYCGWEMNYNKVKRILHTFNQEKEVWSWIDEYYSCKNPDCARIFTSRSNLFITVEMFPPEEVKNGTEGLSGSDEAEPDAKTDDEDRGLQSGRDAEDNGAE